MYNELTRSSVVKCYPGSINDIYYHLAEKIIDSRKGRLDVFNCSNVCAIPPIQFIMDAFGAAGNLSLEKCKTPSDFYCMYSTEALGKLAQEEVKPCSVNNTIIQDHFQWFIPGEDGMELTMIAGHRRELHQEYFVYDPLNLIGTIGGTLGLFLGFSFYDFAIMIIDLLIKKKSKVTLIEVIE